VNGIPSVEFLLFDTFVVGVYSFKDSKFGMLLKKRVFEIIRGKGYFTAALNYRIVWGIDIDQTLCQVPTSKLRARHGYLAV